MRIVKLDLKSPYKFVVMAILIVVRRATSISQMRTDIFPEIDIPVVTMIWTYKGMETSEVSLTLCRLIPKPVRVIQAVHF